MTGQRRYGTATTTSSDVVTNARRALTILPSPYAHGSNTLETEGTATAAPSPIILDGPHRQLPSRDVRRKSAENELHSEREPLLLDSSGERGHGSGGGGGAFTPGSSRRDNGKVLTTILLLNYMIGSGILNSAQVFTESGVGAATVLYVTSGAAVLFGLVVLILAAESAFPRAIHRDGPRLKDLDYADLAAKTVGPPGAMAVDVGIVVQNVGDVCSYVILVGALTSSLLKEWIGDSVGEAWTSFSVVTPVVVLLLVYPPCLVRHLSNLRWVSVLCLMAITAVVGLVVIGGPIYARSYRSEPLHDPELDAPVVYWDWTGAVAKLGSVVFSLASTTAALHAYTAMFPRSERAWRSIAAWATGVGLVLCYSTGLVGYLSFRDATDGNILDNFDGTLASCFKMLMVVHLIFYIPTEVVVMRHSLFAMRGRDVMEADSFSVMVVTFALLAVITCTMIGFEVSGIAEGDLFGYILDLTGGIAGSITTFVLPGLTYLGATREEAFASRRYESVRLRFSGYRAGCRVLVCFGVTVAIAVPLAVFAEIALW